MKTINKLLILLTLICMTFLLHAQSPGKFNYQAVIRDASGNIMSNKPIPNGITFKLYNNAAGAGSLLYQETFSPISTNAFGVVNLQIGSSPAFGNLSTLNWAAGPFYVDIWMDGASIFNGGTLAQLVSVPYALYATKSDTSTYALASPQINYTAGTGISITGSQIINTQPDQLVSITGSGITSIGGSYPNFTISSVEVDGSINNEIQNLNGSSGNVISLSQGGGSVTLNFTVANNQLQLNGTNILPLTDLIPAGTMMAYGGQNIPAGWLLCDGSMLSGIGVYANLFAAISHNFGGTGTSFNLPDLRGRFLRGVDGTANNDPDKNNRTAMALYGNTGNLVGSIQGDTIGSHSHNFPHNVVAGYYTGSGWGIGNGNYNPVYGSDSGTLNAGGNETRPKNVYVNYIIKY